MRAGRIFFVLSSALLGFIGPSAARGAADGVVTYYGILCGVATFSDPDLNLVYPDKDAQDLKTALLKSYNWKEANIKLLLNSEVTQQAIHAAILDVAQKADEDDLVLFYFSGHGSKVADMPPYDEADGADETLIDYYGNDILDDTLAAWINELPTVKYVIFLDTCFSGGMINGKSRWAGAAKSFSDAQDGFGADFVSSELKKDLAGLKRGVVVTASRENEVSVELASLENGCFTHFLLESLSSKADENQNRWISAEECFRYASPLVTAEVPEQHTQMYDGYIRGDLNFYELEDTGGIIAGDVTDSLAVVGATLATDASTIDIEFNQAVQKGAAIDQISIRDSNGLFIPYEPSISGQSVLTLGLPQTLGSFCTYTVTVPADGVRDAAGKGLGTDFSFTFTTQAITVDKATSGDSAGGGCAMVGWPVLAVFFLTGLAAGELLWFKRK